MKHLEITEIVRRDPRYAPEAYEFLFEALGHTQLLFDRVPKAGEEPGRSHHVSGPEILQGAVDLAKRQFGFLARTVFEHWGVHTTSDVGEIVFNLIEANLLSKTESDSRADFQNLFDLPRALTDGLPVQFDRATPQTRRGGA